MKYWESAQGSFAIFATVRYSIGRNTAGATQAIRFVNDCLHDMKDRDVEQLAKEIEWELARGENLNKHEWLELLIKLKKEFDKR